MRCCLILACIVALVALVSTERPESNACCPAPPSGKPVVNADQTVIIIWDAANEMQHFIRQASFRSEADDFGFLVPTPNQPELEESGNEAFPYLLKLTEPETKKMPRPRGGMGCGCGGGGKSTDAPPGKFREAVKVLDDKLVAGFRARVLETKSAAALVDWLKENGYAYSAEVKAWAEPYVEAGWKITALKVAKDEAVKDNKVTAGALRLSFKTDRPLFPYREPDSKRSADALSVKDRLLRIYLVAEARYAGEFERGGAWSGKTAWANKIGADERAKTLEMLKLPNTTGPAEWWLTEFEDEWPYKVAPSDVFFSRAPDQAPLRRDPIIIYTRALTLPNDVTAYALAAAIVAPCLLRFVCKRRRVY